MGAGAIRIPDPLIRSPVPVRASMEESRGGIPGISGLFGLCELGCALPAIHRAGVASTSSVSGKRSPGGCRVRTPPRHAGFHPQSGTDGSAKMVACEQSASPIYQAATRTQGTGKNFVTPEVMISERPAEAADRAFPGIGRAI
jgi:hypothetical protein